MYLRFTLLLFLSFSFPVIICAQEICDNAIDDDADGLVDLNDNDCECNTIIPTSLIPNPSFEEMTCCPRENERLDCAVGWIQASAPTTDYVHTCGGYLGNTSIPAFAPLPFPDGEGGVGFRDGQAQAGSNYKEYVGGCLTEPMEAGVTYRFDFFVGFRDNVAGSKDFEIAVFASADCNALPFGGNSIIGCPANSGDFVQLGAIAVGGSNEWKNVIFEFEANRPYTTIVLGPSCSANPNFHLDPYFYLDRLTLAESSEFGIPFESVSGAICDNDLVLQVEETPGSQYQWYKDGIAIIGENASSLLLEALNDSEGKYLAIITDSVTCTQTQEYRLRIPPYYNQEEANICAGDTYAFGNENIVDAGAYQRTIRASDGCDSIIQLTLEVISNTEAFVRDTFCEGEEFTLLDISTSTPGIYESTLTNDGGCDSVVILELTEIARGEDIEVPGDILINLGESVNITPEYVDPRYISFRWTDSDGTLLDSDFSLSMYRPVISGHLFLEAFDISGCSTSASVSVTVNVNRQLYIPNIFSPDENGINDFFSFYAPLSVEQIFSFSIFDRWGNIVYQDTDIEVGERYKGWDGMYRGRRSPPGVYSYLFKVKFIDGVDLSIAGNVTLVR